ncbi:MAG: serine acetyltransferase [Oscillospiraceae bacterium]|nr:serine acetyltransferase [Oscillospiraceae bacterium]
MFLKKDLYRYFGDKKESVKDKLFRRKQIKYLYYFRKLQAQPNFISRIYYKLRLRRLSALTHIQIHESTRIGEGFYIGHYGRILINPQAVLGKNVNIATGVSIGQENRGARKGCPVIGDEVWIGTNAVVVGNINIGNDVLIAPLAYVNFDVPDHSIVLGNPAKIIHRENATEYYIENKV